MEEFAVLRKQIPTFQVCHPCKDTHTARKQKLFCDSCLPTKNGGISICLSDSLWPVFLIFHKRVAKVIQMMHKTKTCLCTQDTRKLF